MKRANIQLFECEFSTYHDHWLAYSHYEAARYAFSEEDLENTVMVSSMCFPCDSKKGLVYVVNDTRTYTRINGRVKEIGKRV